MGRESVRRRLPELFLEAAMIFFAVMLALAAEEWRENRDRQELADRALRSVVEELRSNLEELESAGSANAETLAEAQAALLKLEEGDELEDAGLGLDISLLSSAAWQSAQMSQAVQYMDFDVMREVSQVYEIQELYDRTQTGVLDRFTEIMGLAEEDPKAAIRSGVIGFSVLVDLHGSLAAAYRATLETLETEGSES